MVGLHISNVWLVNIFYTKGKITSFNEEFEKRDVIMNTKNEEFDSYVCIGQINIKEV